ncbi:endonuclease/exonuclease/phosphatase family protein [Cognatishimia sp. F0-27]|uniref:endonuclease/exonuclease/phosphatase family protein n=1 Tax=Cognatishimia sp. F0-27 TaxID=2816855 RepID=UPI001D0C58EF|nr:endonuclease/exonuclease/phosphatase family protein [Cognatishimia sp. F0-27]MCC1492043.1 endonuclease/exonuclease/phosphatase family protein [Cognatishimia sp. F0-27]
MHFRLVSYNIQKAVGLDLRRDPARVLAVIAALDADVVVLQEADKRLGNRPTALPRFLIEQYTDHVVADVAETDVSLGWHGNAILVRRGWQILETARVPLPSLEPRGAVMARIAPEKNGHVQKGKDITVIGAHLGLVRLWRRRQLRALHEHATEGETSRTVILGDLNEWSMRKGLGSLHPTFDIHTPGRTYPSRRPVGALDRAALGRDLRLVEAGVDCSALARVASDHRPIWLKVALK